MSHVAHSRKPTFSIPRDYLRRRRFTRRLTNVTLIVLLGGSAAYVITRPTGGTAFSIDRPADDAQSAELPAPPPAPSPSPEPTFSEGYDLEAGPFLVAETSDIIFRDTKRNKDIHMRLFYPTDQGKFPVIVFSHGAGGSQNCCELLTKHWASYGYITIQPTHEDSIGERRNSGDANIRALEAVRDALHRPALWQSRPEDVSFVLDALPELEKRIPPLAQKIDPSRVGVAGHSMGSFAAEAIAGARVDLPSRPGSDFTDPRVKAVLCLSPEASGQFGLSRNSFKTLTIPYLGITGSRDNFGPLATPEWHKIPFELSPSGDKYHLYIEGANDMSFIGARALAVTDRPQADAILGYTNSASLAFWDAYLKSDSRAKKYLQSEALDDSSKGATRLARR